jgi:hypothetical protein
MDTRFEPVRIIATDRLNDRVVHLSLDGTFLGVVNDELLLPAALAIDGDDVFDAPATSLRQMAWLPMPGAISSAASSAPTGPPRTSDSSAFARCSFTQRRGRSVMSRTANASATRPSCCRAC